MGPFAHDVTDAALLMEVIAGHDRRDSTSVDRPVPAYTKSLNDPVKGLRIGVPKEFFDAGLDSEVEAAIQEQLETLMEGKTVIAIAHRLSTLSRMDRLVVLDHGRIAEQGTHAGLLRQGGVYARLWRQQSGAFADV